MNIKYYQIIWKEYGPDYFVGREDQLNQYIKIKSDILKDPRYILSEITQEEYEYMEDDIEQEEYFRKVMSRND